MQQADWHNMEDILLAFEQQADSTQATQASLKQAIKDLRAGMWVRHCLHLVSMISIARRDRHTSA